MAGERQSRREADPNRHACVERGDRLAREEPENWPRRLNRKGDHLIATGLTAGVATPMGDERISTRWFTAKEIEAAIDAGEIVDAKTTLSYFFWKRSLRKG